MDNAYTDVAKGESHALVRFASGLSPISDVGGGALLKGETNGFATDFLYDADPAKRVCLKSPSTKTFYGVNDFYQNASTSPKMVYDAAGTLGWSPHNYCLRSDDMSNAVWTKTAGTATAGQFTEDTSSGNHQVSCNVSSLATGIPYSVRVRVRKSGSRNFVVLQFYDGGSINYGVSLNLNTGATAIQFGSPTNITATPTGTANEYDFFYTASTNSGAISLFLWASSDGTITAYTGDGVSGFFASRWQIYRDATALAYLPTTTAARVGLALDYDPVTHAARGLLCEPQATNLLLQSSAFDNAYWFFGGGTITANAVAAPNGGMEGDTFIPTNGTQTGGTAISVTTVAGSTYTFSVYAKAGTLANIWLELAVWSVSVWRVYFNLATGTKGSSVGSPVSYNMTNVGGGWYRVDVTVVMGDTAPTCYIAARPTDNTTAPITGNGTSSAFSLWGVQLETGTVASSYIPTLAATVTRAADQVSVTPASINYSATAGSWWVNTDLLTAPGNARVIGYPSGYTPLLQFDASYFGLWDTPGIIYTAATNTIGSRKAASAFASGDRAVTANGLAPTTSAGAGADLLSPGASILFGNDNGGISHINGYIRQLRYVPRRKSGAEMITETT